MLVSKLPTLRTGQLSDLFESWSPELIPCRSRWSPELIPCRSRWSPEFIMARNQFRTPTAGMFDTLRKVSKLLTGAD